MIACSSPGMISRVTSSVTRRPPNRLHSFSRRSTGSVTRWCPVSERLQLPQLLHNSVPRAHQSAVRKQNNQHKHGSEYDLPVLGKAGEPFLEKKIGCGADDRAVQRAQAAEEDHDHELARELP